MKLPAPAKLNLSLDILGRREDGYHELSMVMLSVSLCDGIELNLTPKPGVLFSCSDPDVPGGEKNTACRAAALFLERAGLAETTGVQIFLEKRIPSQAGMGGGSADAAAVLRGLNELTGFPLPEEDLFELGLQVGADVPFCLAGGVKLAQGVGERLSPAPELPPCAIVVCKPPVGVSTAEAFRRADERTDGGKDYTGAVLAALKTGSLEAVGEALGNDFEDVMAARGGSHQGTPAAGGRCRRLHDGERFRCLRPVPGRAGRAGVRFRLASGVARHFFVLSRTTFCIKEIFSSHTDSIAAADGWNRSSGPFARAAPNRNGRSFL